jgi:hypothetical protein
MKTTSKIFGTTGFIFICFAIGSLITEDMWSSTTSDWILLLPIALGAIGLCLMLLSYIIIIKFIMAVDPWISTNTRNPENGQEVLYCNEDLPKELVLSIPGIYLDGKFYPLLVTKSSSNGVHATHWKPMPRTPSNES